ncbi:MAG TPA: hypothetical protein VGL53_31615 [Bryobacteraceae bacterium]|jgi:hypothetical protein
MNRSAVEDLWRVTLSQIPSLLGRLVYLSSLRDPNTGLYSHHGLAQRFDAASADVAIGESHQDAFGRWLLLKVGEQREDCELYWSSLLEEKRLVAEMWIKTESYRSLFPASASPAQRADFNAHMEILLEWLRNVYAGGGDDRDASQRP